MDKQKGFFKNLLKPFTSTSNRDPIEVDLEKVAAQERKNFPYKTLAAATNNFSPSNKLGEGGFGPVFKGILDDGKVIAVKKLSIKSSQGKKEFQNEAKLLARVQHRNVVTLLGYCVAEGDKLLVYEYVANESLDKILFNSNRKETLDWKRRRDIIAGVAKGLLYLHDEAPYCILHRDIKASNVLLDDKWVPKIGDFGMARLYPEDETHVQTRIAGTNGYMAPEYLMHGKLSKKADVFSFGVVVLELVSGQKNSSFNRDPDSRNLLEWVYKLYKKQRRLEVMDPALISTVDPDQLAMCVQIGLLCVQSDSKLRPEMARVVVMLSKNRNILEEPTGPGYPGSRYRRSSHRTSLLSSGTGNSGMNKSGSSGTTETMSGSSGSTNPGSDPKGKRPMK